MALVHDDLQEHVERAFDTTWERERRRMRVHSLASMGKRIALGMVVVLAVAVVASVLGGVSPPWVAFAMSALLAMVVAVWDSTDWC
jgi:hypothetical protein